MWYFTWFLGIGFAVLLAILNAMWHEAQEDRKVIANTQQKDSQPPERQAA